MAWDSRWRIVQVACVAIAALVHVLSHVLAAERSPVVAGQAAYVSVVGVVSYAIYLVASHLVSRKASAKVPPSLAAGAIALLVAQALQSVDLFLRADSIPEKIWAVSIAWIPFVAIFAAVVVSLSAWAILWLVQRRR